MSTNPDGSTNIDDSEPTNEILLPDPNASSGSGEIQTQTADITSQDTALPNHNSDEKPKLIDVINEDPSDKHVPTTEANQPSNKTGSCDGPADQNSTIPDTKPSPGKKKDDDKLALYKALAIKIKKELVKTRDELQKIKNDYKSEVSDLKKKLQQTEDILESERITHTNTVATLESTLKSIQSQCEGAENELQALRAEYEDYKIRASEIMQKNNPVQFSMQSDRNFIEERNKQLKMLNDDFKIEITRLTAEVDNLTKTSRDRELEIINLKEELDEVNTRLDTHSTFEAKCKRLLLENENLKGALKKSKDRQRFNEQREPARVQMDLVSQVNELACPADRDESRIPNEQVCLENNLTDLTKSSTGDGRSNDDAVSEAQASPSTSSVDSYVHIKPTAIEIISRSSVLEEAQIQIDNLTKSYLDSESTNSLLSEQVRALKEEIRRIQRGTERMDLADNLEYLKNIVLRFLSLDQNQVEQKQRLVPVLSTVLRLSPEETAKLNSIASASRSSVASSLFRLV